MAYRTFVPGIRFRIQSQLSWRVVDCANNDGSAYLLPDNGGEYQMWTADPVADHSDTFYLRQVATGRYLDVRNPGGNERGEVYTHPFNGGGAQMWKLELLSDPQSSRLINVAYNYCLDTNGGDELYALRTFGMQRNQRWLIQAVDVRYSAVSDNVKFGEADLGESEYSSVDTELFNNDGPNDAVDRYERDEATTVSWRLSLTETVGVSLTVSETAGVPDIASETGTATVSLDISVTEEQTSTEEVTYVFDRELNLLPYTETRASAWLRKHTNVQIPFVMTVIVTAREGDRTLPFETTRALLTALQENSARVVGSLDSQQALVEMKGTLRAGYASEANVLVSAVPTRITVDPASGRTDDRVTLAGNGLLGVEYVFFDETPAPFTRKADGTVEATVPLVSEESKTVSIFVRSGDLVSRPCSFHLIAGS